MQKGSGVAPAHARREPRSPAKSTAHALLPRVLFHPDGLNTAVISLTSAGTVSLKCTKKKKKKTNHETQNETKRNETNL